MEVWRSSSRWYLTGETGAASRVEEALAAPAVEATFLDSLDETQQRAVLSAIFAPARPIKGRGLL